MPTARSNLTNADSFPKPFGHIVQRILRERPEPIGRDPVVSAHPMREVHRKYSHLLQFELRFSDRSWRGYIKVTKPREVTLDPDRPPPAERLKREYDLLRRLDKIFAETPDMRIVRPIACFTEYLALITEEAPGRDGVDKLKRRVGFLALPGAMREMKQICRLCGQWLSKLQRGTAAEPVELFSLDQMRRYNEVRLDAIVQHRFRGFDEDMRQRTLGFFDSLAELVPPTDLNICGVHGDFSIGNVLVSKGRITVMDFPTFSQGSIFHDVTFFHHNLRNLALNVRFRRNVIRELCKAFLEGYNPQLDVSSPLFRMFQLQHVLCNLASMASREREPLFRRLYTRYSYYGHLANRHLRWLTANCGA